MLISYTIAIILILAILYIGICEEFASLAVKINCSQMPSKNLPEGGFFDF